MSVMRDFIRGGELHWMQNGASPCGVLPLTDYDRVVLGLVGVRVRAESPFGATDCPICIPTKQAYFKFLRNGGSWVGPWDIRPNEDP